MGKTFVQWGDSHVRGARGSMLQPCFASTTEAEKLALADAVKQRANEQCLPLYVDCFVQRQALRCNATSGNDTANRQAVALQANRFDERYAKAQDVIQDRLSFKPPGRRNSVTVGQIQRVVHPAPVSP